MLSLNSRNYLSMKNKGYFSRYVASKIGLHVLINIFFNLNWIFSGVVLLPILFGQIFQKAPFLHGIEGKIIVASVVYAIIYFIILVLTHSIFYFELRANRAEGYEALTEKEIGENIGEICFSMGSISRFLR